MNVFKRIAEMAQNKFLNVESVSTSNGGGGNQPSAVDGATPSPNANALRASVPPTFAPQRRTRYIPRREQVILSVPSSMTTIGEGVTEAPASTRREGNNEHRPSHRHSFQLQIARNLIEFARGYPNTRGHHRRTLQSKANSVKLSSAHPQNYPNSFADESIVPYKFVAIMRRGPASRAEMLRNAWNPDDRSLNIYVKENGLTAHRHPVPQTTDCIRGKVGYSRGFHVWELEWLEHQRGTHAVVGVATKDAILHSSGYGSLLGTNADSYGWDITSNKCHFDLKHSRGWAYPQGQPPGFVAPAKFYCILDMDEGSLAFATSDAYLGVAFCGLKGKVLHPIVSAVWGQCEVTLRYIGGMEPEPRPLLDICRKRVRVQMGKTRLGRVGELALPTRLEQYVLGKGT